MSNRRRHGGKIFPPIIAVDFDGTLTKVNDFKYFNENYKTKDLLKEGAKEVLQELHDKGCYIILWTCREYGGGLEEAEDFIEMNELPIDAINRNHPDIPFPSRKITAAYYVDDLAYDKRDKTIDWYEIRAWILNDEYFQVEETEITEKCKCKYPLAYRNNSKGKWLCGYCGKEIKNG